MVRRSWHIDSALKIKLAIVVCTGLKITQSRSAFNELQNCARDYKTRFQEKNIGDIDGVQQARQFFREIGIDPTRRRPASEALLSRALKNKPLPAINTLVDVGNWCALDFLLPTCIYDSDKINGNIFVRQGNAGDSYEALNGRTIHFENRYVLADATGPFGSPMTDSKRTAITTSTQNAILGIWAPNTINHAHLNQYARLFGERAVSMCGGNVVEIFILTGLKG